jgi:nitroreductase
MAVSGDELLRFLRRLRAVKEYTAEPVTPDAIEEMLEVGRWSGSGGNRQPTEVIVVRDPEVKQKLGDWGARPAATAAVVLLIVNANPSAVFDEGRLAERLALAAAARGLGSTIATLKNEGPEAVKALLGVPSDRRVVSLVAIGHTDAEARRNRPKNPNPRKAMTEFAHWDRY